MSTTDDDTPNEIEVPLEGGRVLRGHPGAVNAYVAAHEAKRQRNAQWPQTPEGHVDARAALSVLARRFPTLRDADGVDPWDVEAFVRWLCGPVPGGGAGRAGRFILHVWNAHDDFQAFGRELGLGDVADDALKPFNLSEAIGVWDEEHGRAFLSWVEAPFWP